MITCSCVKLRLANIRQTDGMAAPDFSWTGYKIFQQIRLLNPFYHSDWCDVSLKFMERWASTEERWEGCRITHFFIFLYWCDSCDVRRIWYSFKVEVIRVFCFANLANFVDKFCDTFQARVTLLLSSHQISKFCHQCSTSIEDVVTSSM